MPRYEDDSTYSLDDGLLYLSGIEHNFFNRSGISIKTVEKIFNQLGIDKSLYDSYINHNWYEDDIMRWSLMLSVAAITRKKGTFKHKGVTVKIENRSDDSDKAYLDNFVISVNNTPVFQLFEAWHYPTSNYVIRFLNLGLLDKTIYNDWDDTPVLNALYPDRFAAFDD